MLSANMPGRRAPRVMTFEAMPSRGMLREDATPVPQTFRGWRKGSEGGGTADFVGASGARGEGTGLLAAVHEEKKKGGTRNVWCGGIEASIAETGEKKAAGIAKRHQSRRHRRKREREKSGKRGSGTGDRGQRS